MRRDANLPFPYQSLCLVNFAVSSHQRARNWMNGCLQSLLSEMVPLRDVRLPFALLCSLHLDSELDVIGQNFSNSCSALCDVHQMGSGVTTFLRGLALAAPSRPSALGQVFFFCHVHSERVDVLLLNWRWILNPRNLSSANFSYVRVTLRFHGWPLILSSSLNCQLSQKYPVACSSMVHPFPSHTPPYHLSIIYLP